MQQALPAVVASSAMRCPATVFHRRSVQPPAPQQSRSACMQTASRAVCALRATNLQLRCLRSTRLACRPRTARLACGLQRPSPKPRCVRSARDQPPEPHGSTLLAFRSPCVLSKLIDYLIQVVESKMNWNWNWNRIFRKQQSK